ncbi:MAG: flavodoxin family protein [Janthinobacterium lividum]
MASPATSCPLVVLASARRGGDTEQLVQHVLSQVPHHLLNLLDWPVLPYRYEQDYPPTDTFLHLANLLLQHSALVVATPVYWYSMSSPLKVFLDRFTDLITSHKQLGRQLAGKPMFLLVSGADPELPEGFTVPFRQTATYFDMPFVASLYHSNKRPFSPVDFQSFTDKLLSIK